MRLKPSKCDFAAQKVTYLGHVITKDGVQADPSKTEAISQFPCPRDVSTLRGFLGLCNYYRRFVHGFAKIAAPLNNLLKKDVPFTWSKQCEDAFESLKHALTTPPILAYPSMSKPFIVSTDASGSAIGYILGQRDSCNRERVIAYGGRSLNKMEKKWSISERECLALIEAIQSFRPYLANNKFTVLTDHIALKWLHKISHATNGRLARWSIALQGYDFTIEHKAGKLHQNADALSRRSYDSQQIPSKAEGMCIEQTKTSHLDQDTTVEYHIEYASNPSVPSVGAVSEKPDIDPVAVKSFQRECSDFSYLVKYLETGELPEDQKVAKKVVVEAEQYVCLDGTLYLFIYRRAKNLSQADRVIKQLAVPKVLRPDVLLSYHDSIAGGVIKGLIELIIRFV
ncbi:gag-pol fusion protein [Apostichopus japonicus]|uniref:Gag-pol fusion protein n=1 Tax=Stichopus japonicus TaxID=307972 RepID=A0A2G8KE05_STIJA|nr:gag-pol fusion protein [Apostichopus japonicus]